MEAIRCEIMRKQIMVEPKRISPCCNFTTSLPIENYRSTVEQYAKKLDAGIKIPECKLCWQAEDRGITSVRQSGNDSAHTYLGEGITYLDIRLGNECNLACNMCHSDVSTLWGKLNGKASPAPLSEELVNKVMDKTGDLKRISLQGGEPFYGNSYVNFVDKLENKEQIAVDVFSNIITINMKIIKRWVDELKSLDINASVDGYGDVFDYIRWPTNWKKFRNNAVKLHNINKLRLSYFYTIQAFNVLSICDFIEWRNRDTPGRQIVFTTVIHQDEVTYKGLTQQERDEFISKKSKILGMLTPESRELSDLSNFFKLVEDMQPDDELIQKRIAWNQHTDSTRQRYKNRSAI
jgi:sulfatase maturation enzyme AslB (radical SAM superfamily)